MANLGGVPQYPILYRLSDPGKKDGIKLLSSKKLSLILECNAMWRFLIKGIYNACRPRKLSGGVSFRNLVRFGSLSFGISRDSAPINSGPLLFDDTFHSILSLREFLRCSTDLD